ncbi:MAG: hypothetical protein ACXABY_07895 [Candidatus Thorarchaeota archaeon]|jgi:hypothetical protein
MTNSFKEAEKIRAEYRKMLAEKDKPKKETKAESPDESVSSSKSEGEEKAKDLPANVGGDPVNSGVSVKKKRGRPKKKKD